ncbi:MAG TPA: MFS transporter [bacterium]|nr:MFS transporter [bacterium]HQO34447.1 MFS transporter [bacterium]HQQ00122.1 MFS transporter [bacterium]
MTSSFKRLALTTLSISLYGVAIGVAMSAFNNFLSDSYRLNPDTRGWLELPREFPGFMTSVTASLFFFLSDRRMAILASSIAAFGQLMMVSAGSVFSFMILFMMIWSVGDHLYFPVKSALVLACSREENRGRILGMTGSFEVAGIILGGVITRFLAPRADGYFLMFAVASSANLLAALVLLFLSEDTQTVTRRSRIVFRRQYGLYYVLEFLFGARKQIFLTFGPWVLIQVYGRGVETFAILTIVGHVLALAARPLVGWAIDRLGERLVLTVDSMVLIFVCLGYGFADRIPVAAWCLPVALACFLLDQLLFYVDIARTTYLARIVRDRGELSGCLSTGVSINHIASMTVPIFAGSLWTVAGHKALFIGAAVLALTMVFAASRVPAHVSPSR